MPVQQPTPSTSCSLYLSLLFFLLFATGCGMSNPYKSLVLSPNGASVPAGGTVQFSATQNGVAVPGGVWSVQGSPANGSISASGMYSAPSAALPAAATVSYTIQGFAFSASVSVSNPVPTLTAVSPNVLTSAGATTVVLTGTGFVNGSSIRVNGQSVATQYIDGTHVSASITVSSNALMSLQLAVSNPDPGASTSNVLALSVNTAVIAVSPSSLSGGNVTLSLTMPGTGSGSVVLLNGVPMSTTSQSGDTITASGFLAPWLTGSVPVAVTAPDGATVLSTVSVPITPTPVSYDTAARFSTQAAWGPRPDVVMQIQQTGLAQFVDQQLQQPAPSYACTIRCFFLNITQGNSLLRLRTAWAFQTFIPGQTWDGDGPLAMPFEELLERDAFTNFRQILQDLSSDPNIPNLLNLQGNVASTDPNTHPNQNFAREIMQQFSIGPVLLNDDGTTQNDANGNPIPAYDSNTIMDMSRVFTGWNWAPPVNPTYTLWGNDFSQPLVATESLHDQGSKVLFGSVQIPAGQTAAQDRDSALDAIMNHQNTPPFISRLLIQRLVKSQPSPAYVKRIATVFKDDGKGVRGNLAAVVRAILLDPEARQGDTTPDPTDGFVQDPIYFQTFLMSALQISNEDDQSTYQPADLGEGLWASGTVFSYFSPNYLIPGTSINSPEFQLLNNFTLTQRTQLLWSVVTGQQPGFNNGTTGWLYQNFTTLPAMLEALNHVLYHGTMPQEEQAAITAYCSGITDQTLQLQSAIFLALNSDSYTVAH